MKRINLSVLLLITALGCKERNASDIKGDSSNIRLNIPDSFKLEDGRTPSGLFVRILNKKHFDKYSAWSTRSGYEGFILGYEGMDGQPAWEAMKEEKYNEYKRDHKTMWAIAPSNQARMRRGIKNYCSFEWVSNISPGQFTVGKEQEKAFKGILLNSPPHNTYMINKISVYKYHKPTSDLSFVLNFKVKVKTVENSKKARKPDLKLLVKKDLRAYIQCSIRDKVATLGHVRRALGRHFLIDSTEKI